MRTDDFTWDHFRHTILINANLERVYNCIATPSGITKWFIGVASYSNLAGVERGPEDPIQKGDRYHWKWLAKDFESDGQVIEVKPNQMVRMTFGTMWEVTFSISNASQRCRLQLDQFAVGQSKPDQFAHINCCVCWVFFLTNLKSILENGIDLREEIVLDESFVNQ